MSKKKSAKKTTAQKPVPGKKAPPEAKQESPPKLNDPVGEFTEEELREFHTDCANRTRDIRKKAAVMAEAKRSAKIATENYNAATDDLTCYISGFKEIPLLDQQGDSADWRTTPVKDLDIEEWIANLLADANVTTAGALDEAWKDRDMASLGKFTADQLNAIGDALDKVMSEPVPEKKEEAA